MRVAISISLVLLTLIFNTSEGAGKGAKVKKVELKTKLQHKIFHHQHHHLHHHHYHHHPHHPHHHHHHHRHPRYHHHHPHHYHDHKHKHYQHHHPHHHHHHHHHYHNPFKHHLHRHHHFHKNYFHHYPHNQPVHRHHHSHKHHVDVSHHQSNRRSDILHVPVALPNKLRLHVQIKETQATKRQSLPNLLANLGQHLMKLGSSLSPKKSQMEVPAILNENRNNEGVVGNEISETPSIDYNQHVVEDSSSKSEKISEDSRRKNMSLSDVEALLHNALDLASGDRNMESGFSGNGEAEARDAASTNAPESEGAKEAGRRNETFPEPDHGINGPEENHGYDVSNDTVEETADERIHTVENTGQQDQLKDRKVSAGKQDEPPVRGDQPKNFRSETDILTDYANKNTVTQPEQIRENGTQNEPSHSSNESLSEELKNLDANSTSDDGDREIVSVAPETGAAESGKSVTAAESDVQDKTVEKEEKIEISGSGDDSLDDIKGNNDAADADDKLFQEGSGSGEAPYNGTADEEVNGSVQSFDHSENKSFHESESKTFIKESARQSSFSESRAVPEESTDQPASVKVAGNQIMGNQSEEAFHLDSTESIKPKSESHVLEENERSSQPANNDAGKTAFSADSPVKGATIDDENPRENLNEPAATQPVFNESKRVSFDTKLQKGFQTQNGRPNSILDDTKAQTIKPDKPAFNEIDNASGASSFNQVSPEETEGTQDQNSQTDLEGFSEGSKTPTVLDDLTEPSSSDIANPLVVNVDDSQVSDDHEDVSQEVGPEDTSDEIPVYTLSSPVGDDSLATDETTLSPMPTSSVTTSSANFIDTGANMPPGYSESLPSSEEYGTFTASAAPSQEVFNTFSQGGGLQRDMLDDPVQESLETAVDSKSS